MSMETAAAANAASSAHSSRVHLCRQSACACANGEIEAPSWCPPRVALRVPSRRLVISIWSLGTTRYNSTASEDVIRRSG